MESKKRKNDDDDWDSDNGNAIIKTTIIKYTSTEVLKHAELNKPKKRGLSENLSDSDHDTSHENLNIKRENHSDHHSNHTYPSRFSSEARSHTSNDDLHKKKIKSDASYSHEDIHIKREKDIPNNNHSHSNKFPRQLSSELTSEITSSTLNDNTLSKKLKSDNDLGSTSSMGYKLMKRMGYKDGEGIGFKPGRVNPINESNQVGKQGLGFKVKHFEQKVDNWDYEIDRVTSFEEAEWLNNVDADVPSLDVLLKWKLIGKKKRILDDEFEFCTADTLQQVLECKSIFDNLDNKDMINARYRSNPFEAIGSRFFQNRAALKMANLDAVFGFMFTDPRNSDGTSKIEENEPLYFCDVCAGPGGFSEYVLWRKKYMAKGFGMTLKEDNDFCLDDFVAGQPEYFETHYGLNGARGDGDVTKSQNLKEFQRFVVEQTNHRGVHFMMADGGFSVEGNENIQEILSKQLYLCQFLCALSVLRNGGNFVCKIFDIFTPFSVGLIYLMYLCFDRISIHKPVTSRPANSERYLVCENAKESKEIVYNYLFNINDCLNEHFRDEQSDYDVTQIVPLAILKEDKEFYNYVFSSNEKIGRIQTVNLKKIQAFATNKNLHDPRQSELIFECLEFWKIPNLNRAIFASPDQQQKLNNHNRNQRFQKVKIKSVPINQKVLLEKLNFELSNKLDFDLNRVFSIPLRELTNKSLIETFKKCSIYDYKAMIGSGQLVFLLGCGRSSVYELELNSPLNCFNQTKNPFYSQEWRQLSDFNIELPRETLLLAEKVVEYRGTEQAQQNTNAIHIIDALFIEGQNMIIDQSNHNRVVSIEERHSKLEIFVKSISKKSKPELNTIRLKDLINVEKVEGDLLDNLLEKKAKSSNIPYKNGIHIPLNFATEYYVYPSGVYFFKNINYPWSLVRSKSSGNKYYFNSDSGQSTYDFPNENKLFSDPRSYFENLLLWKFAINDSHTSDLVENRHLNNDDIITRQRFNEFMKLKI